MKYLQLLTFGSAFLLPLQILGVTPDAELVGDLFTDDCCTEESAEEKVYPVSQIVFAYDQTHPKHVSLEKLEQIEIPLYEVGNVLYGTKADKRESRHTRLMTVEKFNDSGKTYLLSLSALEEIIEKVNEYFVKHNINWTVVYVSKNEITPDGIDRRPKGETTLTIEISTPMIKQFSVRYVNAANPKKERDNPKLSDKISDQLPLSLPDPSTGYPGDFINSNLLNNYLHSLNRHPNRRVDLEIGPTRTPGEVALDFVITEDQPWHFYFNANNNVPRPLHCWQESIGFIHTQLTGNDDILKINASTDSFDRFYSVDASYEAPLGRSIKNRWQISGNYNRFISAEFALPSNLFVGTQAIVNGEIVSNIAQWDKLFLDLVADLQYRHIHNEGHFFFSSATKNFLLPEIGVKAIQLKRKTKMIASLSLQSSVSSLFWDVGKNLSGLGRANPSENWAIVQAGFYGSFFLEPVLLKKSKVKHLANEIVVVGQLQNAFNQRLIPELEGILGGLYTIRGYPQSTISGDNLYMGSVEYRFHLPAQLKTDPNASTKIFGKSFRWAPAQPLGQTDWDFLFRAFFDVGQTTVNQAKHFERDHLIMGIGVGLELVLWHNVFIRGDYGHGLREANGISKGNNQYYFSSTIIF